MENEHIIAMAFRIRQLIGASGRMGKALHGSIFGNRMPISRPSGEGDRRSF
jgi:hypothetical protein